MSTALSTLTKNMAQRFALDSSNAQELMTTLKATAFKGQVSDAQMTALMLVAQQYGLNPWTREIYAFPDRQNGIVPVVGVDGWSRIINENPQFDGVDFQQDEESCTCTIYRKDRNHPIKVTEWLAECRRNAGPWQSHPKRMLRHKALIQCARLAFGFVGIYDQDEAERIIENAPTDKPKTGIEYAENARQQVNVDSVERDALVGELERIAKDNGIEAYGAVWQKLTKEQRQSVGAAEHARLKEVAQAITVEEPDYV